MSKKSMKKIALFLLIVVSACHYDDLPTTTCGVKDPANDLPWLKEMIHELEQSSLHSENSVLEVVYNNELGFYVTNCCATCNYVAMFYKCSGEQIVIDDVSKLETKGIIWKPLDYSCGN